MAGYTERMATREDHVAARRWMHTTAWTEEDTGPTNGPTPDSLVTEMLANLSKMPLEQKKQTVQSWWLGGVEKVFGHIIKHQAPQLEMPEAEAVQALKECYESKSTALFAKFEQEVEISQTWAQTEADKVREKEAALAANKSTVKGGSKTAKGTCNMRHCAAFLGFGPDHLAKMFNDTDLSSDEMWVKYKSKFDRNGNMPGVHSRRAFDALKAKQEEEPHMYKDAICYLQCRTCVGDDAVMQWVEDYAGGCNIILLGAGYDTKFYRLNLPDTAQLFEVDAAGTQEEKLSLLEASGTDLPNRARVNYVAVDFQQESWMERLLASGLRADLPSFIVWEGVTMYLPQEVVEQTLKTLAEGFSQPAAIFFDYYHPQFVEEFRERMKSSGEPWIFGIASDSLVGLIAGLGLKELDHLSVKECVQRYMPITSEGESLGIGSPFKFFMIAGNHFCP